MFHPRSENSHLWSKAGPTVLCRLHLSFWSETPPKLRCVFFLQNMRQPQWGMAQLVKRRLRIGDVQLIWKICSSQIGSSPQMKMKNMWNHLVIWFPSPRGFYTHKDSLFFSGGMTPTPNHIVFWITWSSDVLLFEKRHALQRLLVLVFARFCGFSLRIVGGWRGFSSLVLVSCLVFNLSDQPGCASTNLSLTQWGLEHEYTNTPNVYLLSLIMGI